MNNMEMQEKIEMYERMIAMMQVQLDRYHMYVTQMSSKSSKDIGNNISMSVNANLFEVFDINVGQMEDSYIKSQLSHPYPAISSLLNLLVHACSSKNKCILKLAPGGLLEYMDQNEIKKENASVLCEKIYSKMFNRCKSTVTNANNDVTSEDTFNAGDTCYENIMIFTNNKITIRNKLQKEFINIIKHNALNN